MEIKFEGQTYNITQDMWDAMNAHALERGMDMTEYIAEAFTKLKNESEPQHPPRPDVPRGPRLPWAM